MHYQPAKANLFQLFIMSMSLQCSLFFSSNLLWILEQEHFMYYITQPSGILMMSINIMGFLFCYYFTPSETYPSDTFCFYQLYIPFISCFILHITSERICLLKYWWIIANANLHFCADDAVLSCWKSSTCFYSASNSNELNSPTAEYMQFSSANPYNNKEHL